MKKNKKSNNKLSRYNTRHALTMRPTTNVISLIPDKTIISNLVIQQCGELKFLTFIRV